MALLTSPDFEGVSLYHGSTDETPDLVRPGRMTTWWHSMPHDDYLDPKWDEADEDHNRELGAELRTAYANQVYEAFRTADDPVLRLMAETHGLEGLGTEAGILFVTADSRYAEKYGNATEIDIDSEGVLAILEDENASRPSWLLVMKVGSPFPKKHLSPGLGI